MNEKERYKMAMLYMFPRDISDKELDQATERVIELNKLIEKIKSETKEDKKKPKTLSVLEQNK